MTTAESGTGLDEERQKAIKVVAQRTLVFGEFCAKHIGEEPFQDPVMHTYFLMYMMGAVDSLGADESHGYALSHDEKLAAMREALLAFGTADAQEVSATVRMLEQAADEPAIKIKTEGRDAAKAWHWGDNEDATRHFLDLMQDPANFPREVERQLGQSTDTDESSIN